MSSTRTPADSANSDARATKSREGTHTVSLDVAVHLVPVPDSHHSEEGREDYFVYLQSEVGDEPEVGSDVELGTVSTFGDEIWHIHTPPDYLNAPVHGTDAVGGFELALRRILELSSKVRRRFGVDERGRPMEIVDPPAPGATEGARGG